MDLLRDVALDIVILIILWIISKERIVVGFVSFLHLGPSWEKICLKLVVEHVAVRVFIKIFRQL